MNQNEQKKRLRRKQKEMKNRRWQKMLSRKINNRMGAKLVGLFLLVILALVGLAVRITFINVNDGKQYERIVLNQAQQQYESRTIPFKRGDIRDRNGTILATSDKVYNLILDCKVVNSKTKVQKDPEDTSKNPEMTEVQYYLEPTIEALVNVFGEDEQNLREILAAEKTKNSQYYVLRENLSISDKQRFEDYTAILDTEDKSLSEEELASRKAQNANRRNVMGVWFEEDYLRIYPMNSQACDLIGFTYEDNTSDWGIEGYYSDILNGTNGRQFGYFNSEADVEQTIIDPVPGKNVISTIDVNIQQIIRSALEKFYAQYSNGPNGPEPAENIGVVVMNPDTGEILGMDSSNWYDLNHPRLYTKAEFDAMSDEQYELVKKQLPEMWRNFCVSDSFEPGSTFKPITVAAAMETAVADNKQMYYCDGLEMIKNATMHCVIYPDEHKELNLEGALRVSCNDVLMQVGQRLGIANMLKYQQLFNFGMKTGIDLPGENAGVLHTEEGMGEVELATSSFGQGFTCTMVQEAAAFSAVVNGGYYYKPHVVSAITDSSGAITEHIDPVVERQVISENVSNQIREWLREVVETGGSGEHAKVPGYSMAGKTGTAQKVNSETKAYDGSYVVSFIGCAPVEDPEVVVYVVVDCPNTENQGSSIYAQGIAQEIFMELLPYMNIFPEDPAATEAFMQQLAAAEAAGVQNPEAEAAAPEVQPEEVPAEPAPENPAEPAPEIPAEPAPENGEGEQPVLDADIPAPPAEVPDETVQNGGNDLYSEGIPNSQ